MTCESLGTRLRNIENSFQSVGKTILNFIISDWILNGDYYELTFTAAQHTRGLVPEAEAYIKVSTGIYHDIILDQFEYLSDGTIILRVVSEPDARFDGRVVVM